eukprot:444427_1
MAREMFDINVLLNDAPKALGSGKTVEHAEPHRDWALWIQFVPQSYSGIPKRGIKFNGDSLAVKSVTFSSNVNKDINEWTRSFNESVVSQNAYELKFLEH